MRLISLDSALGILAAANEEGEISDALLVNLRERMVDLFRYGASDVPETRRRLTESAREWGGPDEWQVWHGGRCNRPSDDTYGKVPDGFTPIGPWKFVAVYETSDCGPASVWERPLRRVSP